MKMLITKGVTSENSHAYRFDWFLSQIASTALRVEYCCNVNPALNVSKWLTFENIHKKFRKVNQKVIKFNPLHYFNKVIETVTF